MIQTKEPETLQIVYRGEMGKVNVPQDGMEHVITVISSPDGESDGLYMDGAPVDHESGELILAEASEEVLSAADNLAKVWSEGGWKLSKDYTQIQAAVERYNRARVEHEEEASKRAVHLKDKDDQESMCKGPAILFGPPEEVTCVQCLRCVVLSPVSEPATSTTV